MTSSDLKEGGPYSRPDFRITPVKSGFNTVRLTRVKPRATLGLIFLL